MTKLEFDELIASFNREPGYYTKDEFYQIGVAHKQLIQGKSWNDLAERIGWNGSGESYRQYVLKRQQRDGTAVRNPRLITDEQIRDLDAETASKALENQLESIYKEKTKVRDTYNVYRRGLRDDARIEDMKEAIKNCVETLEVLPKITKEVTCERDDRTEAVLMLSDLHIGVECDNFYNKYNKKIASERLGKLASSVINYCRKANVYKLNILNMGDMIHGIIHTNARLEEEMDVVEQVMVASELLSQFMNLVQAAAPVVTYRSVTDNHSRAIANKNEAIEKENFNKLIDWYIEERLKDTKINFVRDNIDDGIGMFKTHSGKTIMFSHGHQDSLNQSVQNYIGLTREWVDYILLAHYHSSKSKEFQGCNVIVNGSIVGTEQYAFGKRLFSEASQTLLIFDWDNLLTYKINIQK